MRQYSLFDQIILHCDRILISKSENKLTKNQSDLPPLSLQQKKRSASLMRVNHSGEVCAQALYLGQAWVARDPALVNMFYQAAEEEKRHLAWCANRIKALGGRTSYLNPLWAAGSLGIGIFNGLLGDKWSLGFLAETENQVITHLQEHLDKLPPQDKESREILEKMKTDELQHANHALALGGIGLPKSMKRSMKFISKMMTFTARYL